MKPWQRSIGRQAAIALSATNWWKDKTAREIAEFQLTTAELCMPFGEFHRAMGEALGRSVWTHEFGLDLEGLRAELLGQRPAPSFSEILALIPADKVCVVVDASGATR